MPRLTQKNEVIAALLERGQYAAALPLAKDALFLEIAEGPTHDVCVVYFHLALAHHGMEEYEEAEACYKRVLNLETALLGLGNSNSSSTLECLGILYLDMGRYEEAEEKLLRVPIPDEFTKTRILTHRYEALWLQGKKDEATKAIAHFNRLHGLTTGCQIDIFRDEGLPRLARFRLPA